VGAVASTGECQTLLGSDSTAAATRLATRIEPRPGDTWLFGRIQDIAVDRAGRVYVLDNGDQKIRVFSADGKLLRTIGRTGRGPGEFTRPRKIEVVNDTLWVADNANARLTALSTVNGSVLRSSRAAVYDQFFEGVTIAGLFTVRPDELADPTATKPMTLRIRHEMAGSQRGKEIGTMIITRPPLVFRTYVGEAKKSFGAANLRQPLDDRWIHQVSPSGRSIVLLERAQRASSAGFLGKRAPSALRLVEIGWKGDTIRDRTFTVPSRAVTSADITAIADSLAQLGVVLAGAKPFGVPQEIRDSLYKPPTWPPVTEFLAGLDGSIWLRQPQPPSKTSKFWRLAADGKELPPVVVPGHIRPFRVSSNKIWGIAEDEDGVQSVQVLDVLPVKR
jgi:hypothetical protein